MKKMVNIRADYQKKRLPKPQKNCTLFSSFALKLSLVDAPVQDKTCDGFGSVGEFG